MRRTISALALTLLAACAPLQPSPSRSPAATAATDRSSTPAPASTPAQRRDTPVPLQPEAASKLQPKPGWASRRFAVAAAHPLAVDAGYQMLKAGGSAVDAAVAVQMVLTLVEPQSSGIGGGAFLLHHDGQVAEAYDGRETAPARAEEDLFLDEQRRPLPFDVAAIGGRAVGTPGVVRMLALAHGQHGRLSWKKLFEPAIALAESGFPVGERMHALLRSENALKFDPVAASYFYDDRGRPWPVGHRLKNPELAAVLRRIADEGAQAFYEGELAHAIVERVRNHPDNPGRLTLDDLSGYQAKVRPPLCFVHSARPIAPRNARTRHYRICGMPPPSSGTLAMGQIMGLVERTPARRIPPVRGPGGLVPAADWLHFYAEASRLAIADRAVYPADPDYVPAPAGRWDSLLDADYLTQRARLIPAAPGAHRMPQAPPGIPEGIASSLGPMPEQPEYGTSHISIIDAHGNALAMTSSIEAAWGARLMVNRGQGLAGGFLLNNQLTDFSFEPRTASGAPIANRVEPGKRPRSSMTPTLVFDRATGELVLSAGSPGGGYIFHYTAKLLYGMLHWGLNAQKAIDLPNFAVFSGPVLLEERRFARSTIDALRARDHRVVELPLPSGLQAVQTRRRGLFGGADPRREGWVKGD